MNKKAADMTLNIVVVAVILLIILVVVLYIFRSGIMRANNTSNTQLTQAEICSKNPNAPECTLLSDIAPSSLILLPWFYRKKQLQSH